MIKLESIILKIKQDLISRRGIQTLSLFSAQVLLLGTGILIGIINTRTLGPVDYGILACFFTFTSFTVIFFRFGLFSSAGLLLAQTKDELKKKELIGASVIFAFLVGICYAVFIFISSFYVDGLMHTNIGWIFRYVSILIVFLPFTIIIPLLCRGLNQIRLLSLFTVIPNILYLCLALILMHFKKIDPFEFILINLVSSAITIIIIIILLRPSFENLSENIKLILEKTRIYGKHLYLGQCIDLASSQLSGLFIAIFVNTTQLGFFSLATNIVSPMVNFSQSLAITKFTDFVDQKRITTKVIFVNFIWLVVCIIGLILLGKFVIHILFGDAFLPAYNLIPLPAIAASFQGMYQPFNMFIEIKKR